MKSTTLKVLGILCFAIGAGTGCNTMSGGRDGQPEFATAARAIDSAMATLEQEGFSGSILVSRRGQVLVHKGYGFANKVLQIRNQPETMYAIASLTKLFTAAAVLKLESEGQLATGDHLAKFLGDFPPPKNQTTVHHLATHTAGLVVAGTDLYSGPDRTPFLDAVRKTPAESTPGEKYRYTNAGYAVLAAVIEAAAATSFEQYIQRELLVPLQLNNTTFVGLTADFDQRIATHYLASGQVAELEANDWGTKGASGMISSVGDLHTWVSSLLAARALSVTATSKMFTKFSEESYGWHIDSQESRRRYHKGGGLRYAATQVLVYPDDGVIIVWANNDTGRSWRAVLNATLTRLVFADDAKAN